MRIFGDAAMAAIVAGTARVGGALEIACAEPMRVWSGEGMLASDLLLGAEIGFTGIGNRGLAQVTSGAIGSAAQSLTLTLSGIEPAALALVDAEDLRQAPVALWRLIFDSSGTVLLDAHVFRRGRVDTMSREEVKGGSAAITIAVEGAARGMGRRTGRMRTDADQRLIDTDDGGLSRVSYAGEKKLYWGGTVPQRPGAALR